MSEEWKRGGSKVHPVEDRTSGRKDILRGPGSDQKKPKIEQQQRDESRCFLLGGRGVWASEFVPSNRSGSVAGMQHFRKRLWEPESGRAIFKEKVGILVQPLTMSLFKNQKKKANSRQGGSLSDEGYGRERVKDV